MSHSSTDPWRVGIGAEPSRPRGFLPRDALQDLIRLLRREGYTVLGPTIRHNAISLQPLESADELPKGVNDQQDGGRYRLVPGDPDLSFQYVVGPDGPKTYLFPAKLPLFEFHVGDGRFELDEGLPAAPKYAMLGVRPCELAAVRVQDRVFGLDDEQRFGCASETWYRQVREKALFIVVNCTSPSGSCFCASWGTGPEAKRGFDLALTELRGGFAVTVGSERGQAIVERLSVREPTTAESELAELKLHRAREQMGRHLDTEDVKDLLDHTLEHPEWDDVALRCLSCGNCTMVCPTCFCCTVICGICPVAYQMSACHALERAMGVFDDIDPAIRQLRTLLYCGEWIESHVLHMFMLHLPDFLGYESGLSMAADHREIVRRSLRIKRVGNEIVAMQGGRSVHPVGVCVGGFYAPPDPRRVVALLAEVQEALDDMLELTLWLAENVDFPEWDREYEFVALSSDDEYPMNLGRIRSSQGLDVDQEEFDAVIEERQVPYSTALQSVIKGRGAYLVGPLARLNLNAAKLHPLAAELLPRVCDAVGRTLP